MRTDPEKQLRSILETVETLGACRICFHDFYRHILEYIPDVPLFHQNRYCMSMKKMFPEQTQRCIRFDRNAVVRHLELHPGQFFKLCPFQVLELVVPVRKEGALCGVIFLGPFRAAAPLPPDSLIATPKGLPRPVPEQLPPLDRQGMEHLANLGYMLSCCISEIIRDMELPPAAAPAGRKALIEQFISTNFNKGITLGMLAEFLNLSESRTSRLLKEYFNAGLTGLVNRQRLNYAINTLQRAEVSACIAAQRAGFGSVEYFHRLFRRETGMTPQEYRKRHQRSER